VEDEARRRQGWCVLVTWGDLQMYAIPDASASLINIVATNFNFMAAAIEYI